ncbi:hypothetical protein A259_28269, partial [Pseudomonas syringae pv. actinidiae ICMP 19070]
MFQVVFAGVPPGHFDGGQFDCAGTTGHQCLALFTGADQAPFAGQVAQLWLIRITPQARHFGGRQRRQLRTG